MSCHVRAEHLPSHLSPAAVITNSAYSLRKSIPLRVIFPYCSIFFTPSTRSISTVSTPSTSFPELLPSLNNWPIWVRLCLNYPLPRLYTNAPALNHSMDSVQTDLALGGLCNEVKCRCH